MLGFHSRAKWNRRDRRRSFGSSVLLTHFGAKNEAGVKRFPAFSAFFINAVTAKRFLWKTRSVDHLVLFRKEGVRSWFGFLKLAFGLAVGSRKRFSYLVDSASSHMLVSKIKPCMSKYTQIILWNCEWLIKSVIVYLMFLATWITVVILELIHA